MAGGRRRNAGLPVSRRKRWSRSRFLPSLTWNEILTAFAHAWSASTVAVVFLYAAVGLAPMWDRAIFAKALLEALNTDPELLQPAYEVPIDIPAARGGGAPVTTASSEGEAQQ